LFNPQITRDALPSESTYEADDAGFTWEDYASERNLGDGLAGEPLSAKLVATNLYAGYDEATVETELHSPLATQAALDAASPSTSISAASFVTRPRRMSTRLAAGTGIKAPTGSNRDPILVDEDEESSEDDLEIIEAAPAKRPRVGGKTTAGAGAGSRATTGGKAPARKTTAGKTVSRKATKSVKSTGGKAPTKGGGRRKSVQD
jgi:mediator of RNA polymerase II transcription subunit 12